MLNYCYLNGKISSLAKAGLPLNDIGILRGYGCFTLLRTYNQKPFLLKEHLKRIKKAARILNLKISLSQKEAGNIIDELIKKNKAPEAAIRIVLTGGPSDNGFSRVSPSFFILVDKINAFSTSAYQKGIRIITRPHLREIPEIKTTNYITALKLQKEMKKTELLKCSILTKAMSWNAPPATFLFSEKIASSRQKKMF